MDANGPMEQEQKYAARSLALSSLAGKAGSAPTLRQRLTSRLEALRDQMKSVEDAIEALDETPGSEKLLDALSRCGM